MNRFLFLILLLMATVSQAYQSTEIELPSGTAMSVNQFTGDGRTLLLWLPSERGLGQGYIPVALDLAAMDYDVWSLNLHETYILPSGRNSLIDVDLDDLLSLLEFAENRGFEEVFLIGSSRSVQLALKTAYQWQLQYPQSTLLKGLLTFSPHLVKGRTEMGQGAEYVDIARYSNLPVYMLQAQHSTKFARSWEIARQLEQGGSPVYLHFLHGVQGGFHMRPVEDLTDVDLQRRADLPQIIEAAMTVMRHTPRPPIQQGLAQQAGAVDKTPGVRAPALHPFKGEPIPPVLSLMDLQGQRFDLHQSAHQVVLVNFWATWCGPCVEEIPSLSRLVEKFEDRPFKVVAVNIGESPEDIRHFVKSIPVNFDILLDRNGHAVRDWKVYAYPSNFLIDRNGKIRYAYRGALEWDAPSIIQTIEELL